MTSIVEDAASADAVLRRVLDTTLRNATTRPLPDLLTDIADSVVQVLQCRCVAISVGTPDGRLECFVTAGDTAAAARLFGGPFAPDDPLGDVAAEAVTVQFPNPDNDGAATGPARLGMPILLRGRNAGALYLGEPIERPEFTEADSRAAHTVALGTANVIEKSRTASANRRREAWYESGGELAREIVAGGHSDPLQLIVDRVLRVAEADVVSVIQPGTVEGALVVAASAGAATDHWTGTTLIVPPAMFHAIFAATRPLDVEHAADTPLSRVWRERLGIDALLAVPLSGSSIQRGLLAMARNAGAPAFTPAEATMAMMFANTVALALELSQSQERRDQVALMADRGRIARDLHDHVIQRLYALGLALQSASQGAPPELATKLAGEIDEIDETIKQIRTTVFRLTRPILSAETSLRARVDRLIDELEPALAFRAALATEGPIDFAADPEVVDDCVAVLREALTNIARHAHASRAEVTIRLVAGQLQLSIRDDGHGIGDTSRRSGLANLRARAENYGGSLRLESSAEGGTSVYWTIPIAAELDG